MARLARIPLFNSLQVHPNARWASTERRIRTWVGPRVVCPYICELPGEDSRWHFSIDMPDCWNGIDTNGFPTRQRSLANGYGTSKEEVEAAIVIELARLRKWFGR